MERKEKIDEVFISVGEKTNEFFNIIIPVYHNMGEDYTSQSRSEFDWFNLHLYIYSRKLLAGQVNFRQLPAEMQAIVTCRDFCLNPR